MGAGASIVSRSRRAVPGMVVALVGVLLTSGSVFAGLWGDDFQQRAFSLAQLSGTSELPWWAMFELADVSPAQRFGGVVPWWTAEDLHVAFFRPVAVATHLLDHVLWPDRPALMHVHSLVYFGLLCFTATGLYRQIDPRSPGVWWAGLIFAASCAHVAASWIANRNALLSALFGVLALRAYLYWRSEQWRPGAWWAPVLLVFALLSAEVGVSTLAFVVGFELTRSGEPLRERVLSMAPMLGVVGVWRLAYGWAGYGATASGAYIDPIVSPLVFLDQLPARVPWLLGFAFVPLRALAVQGIPSWVLPLLLLLFATTTVAVSIFVVRHWPRARLWVVCALLGLLPLVASLPGERVLTFVVLGLSPIIGMLLVAWGSRFSRSWPARVGVAAVGLSHLVVSPAVLAYGSWDHTYGLLPKSGPLPGLGIDAEEGLKGKSLVVVNLPTLNLMREVSTIRAVAGRSPPSFVWILGASTDQVEVSRIDARTIELHAETGYLLDPFSAFYRGPQRPLSPGDRFETLVFTAEVREVLDGWRPSRVRFRFALPLSHSGLRFVIWRDGDLVEWTPPPRP